MTREEQIYQDKKTMTAEQVMKKYGISRTVVFAICRKCRLEEQVADAKREARYYREKYCQAVIDCGEK